MKYHYSGPPLGADPVSTALAPFTGAAALGPLASLLSGGVDSSSSMKVVKPELRLAAISALNSTTMQIASSDSGVQYGTASLIAGTLNGTNWASAAIQNGQAVLIQPNSVPSGGVLVALASAPGYVMDLARGQYVLVDGPPALVQAALALAQGGGGGVVTPGGGGAVTPGGGGGAVAPAPAPGAWPSWALPAALGGAALVVGYFALRRPSYTMNRRRARRRRGRR